MSKILRPSKRPLNPIIQLDLWDSEYEAFLVRASKSVSDRHLKIKMRDWYNSTQHVRDYQDFERVCSVYCHFDISGVLLYVGVSWNPSERIKQHEKNSPWFKDIHSISVEWVSGRITALNIERYYIKTKCPIHNVVHSVEFALKGGDV